MIGQDPVFGVCGYAFHGDSSLSCLLQESACRDFPTSGLTGWPCYRGDTSYSRTPGKCGQDMGGYYTCLINGVDCSTFLWLQGVGCFNSVGMTGVCTHGHGCVIPASRCVASDALGAACLRQDSNCRIHNNDNSDSLSSCGDQHWGTCGSDSEGSYSCLVPQDACSRSDTMTGIVCIYSDGTTGTCSAEHGCVIPASLCSSSTPSNAVCLLSGDVAGVHTVGHCDLGSGQSLYSCVSSPW